MRIDSGPITLQWSQPIVQNGAENQLGFNDTIKFLTGDGIAHLKQRPYGVNSHDAVKCFSITT
jgi:hypothetical protein